MTVNFFNKCLIDAMMTWIVMSLMCLCNGAYLPIHAGLM